MTVGNNTLTFTYDVDGRPVAVTYNGTTYFYATNIQGDVLAIMDADEYTVAAYSYDAWGKLLSVTGSMASTLGAINPLRYRGYVYDTETDLYYVSSRYYDPEMGRWINADSVIAGVGGSIQGYNMFAYCFNNPVNMSDPSGNWPKWAKEIANRVKYAFTMTVRIFTSPLKAINAKAGVGVGIGGEVSGKIEGTTISVAAKKSYTDSLQFKDGKFDITSTNSEEFGFSVGKISFGHTHGESHSLCDPNCTCDIIDTPFVRKSECAANKEFVEETYVIGVSVSLYFLIGFEVSLGFDFDAFSNELIDIYNTEYQGYY